MESEGFFLFLLFVIVVCLILVVVVGLHIMDALNTLAGIR
jgi:hypothetical protein